MSEDLFVEITEDDASARDWSSDFWEHYQAHQEYLADSGRSGKKLACCSYESELNKDQTREYLNYSNRIDFPQNLMWVNLRDADLHSAKLDGVNLGGARIGKSALNQTENWNFCDFTMVRLYDEEHEIRNVDSLNRVSYDQKLLSVEESRDIIIARMKELEITTAIGLGKEYESWKKTPPQQDPDVVPYPSDLNFDMF